MLMLNIHRTDFFWKHVCSSWQCFVTNKIIKRHMLKESILAIKPIYLVNLTAGLTSLSSLVITCEHIGV